MLAFPVYHVITGNVHGARQVLPDSDWNVEDQLGVRARTSGGNNDNDDDQGGDMPSCIFKEKSNREETKMSPLRKGDSEKKTVQPKGNDKRARRDVKVKGSTTEEVCVAGPVVTRAQAKKSEKIHLLKVKVYNRRKLQLLRSVLIM